MACRRFLCILLAVLLLSALLMLPASGISSLAFAAVNDTLTLTLSGDSLPFYAGGTLYVPYTVFNPYTDANAASLGFYPSYNTADKTLTLFNRNSRLVFDLAAGNVTDENKVTQDVSIVTRGGIVFLPAAFCANHFGVRVSELTSQNGYTLVRFTTGVEIYDDSLFIEKAESLISYRVSQFVGSNTPDPPAVDPPAEPDNPVRPPDDTPNGDDPALEPPQIYLAVTDAASMADALDVLSRARLQAAFFLTADEIAENEALVRRIAAEGHAVGLTVPEGGDAAVELRRANGALDRTLKCKSLLALLPESVDASAVEGSYTVFVSPASRLTATAAAQVHGEPRLLICTAGTLSASLSILQEADAEFARLLETTALP